MSINYKPILLYCIIYFPRRNMANFYWNLQKNQFLQARSSESAVSTQK